jgi:hypothetical protein
MGNSGLHLRWLSQAVWKPDRKTLKGAAIIVSQHTRLPFSLFICTDEVGSGILRLKVRIYLIVSSLVLCSRRMLYLSKRK